MTELLSITNCESVGKGAVMQREQSTFVLHKFALMSPEEVAVVMEDFEDEVL